jgi:hypothetical protein
MGILTRNITFTGCRLLTRDQPPQSGVQEHGLICSCIDRLYSQLTGPGQDMTHCQTTLRPSQMARGAIIYAEYKGILQQLLQLITPLALHPNIRHWLHVTHMPA